MKSLVQKWFCKFLHVEQQQQQKKEPDDENHSGILCFRKIFERDFAVKSLRT